MPQNDYLVKARSRSGRLVESRMRALSEAEALSRVRQQGMTPIAVEHLTVPHEIGHAIGLPHVGVFHDLTKSEHQCMVAGIDPSTTQGWESPGADRKGGKDPYGNYSSEDVMRNIMGYGQGKALWNFLPWINRAHVHTCHETHISDWRFSSTWVPPQSL